LRPLNTRMQGMRLKDRHTADDLARGKSCGFVMAAGGNGRDGVTAGLKLT